MRWPWGRTPFVEPELRFKKFNAISFLPTDFGEEPELGVCHAGSLLLDYRPGGRTDPEELVELVHTHLNRLQRHVGRQLREPPPQLNRVYLCGEQSAVDRAYPVFAASQQFDVEKIDPANIQATWEFAEPMEDSAAVPALGALLNTYLPSSERDVPNFMEHILASTREPLKPILVRSLIPLAAVLLVALTIFGFNLSKQRALDALQSQLDSLAGVQAQDRELRLQKDAAEAKFAALKALASGLISLPAGDIVARIGHCMPTDVWLSRLEISDMKTIELNGASPSSPVISNKPLFSRLAGAKSSLHLSLVYFWQP